MKYIFNCISGDMESALEFALKAKSVSASHDAFYALGCCLYCLREYSLALDAFQSARDYDMSSKASLVSSLFVDRRYILKFCVHKICIAGGSTCIYG